MSSRALLRLRRGETGFSDGSVDLDRLLVLDPSAWSAAAYSGFGDRLGDCRGEKSSHGLASDGGGVSESDEDMTDPRMSFKLSSRGE